MPFGVEFQTVNHVVVVYSCLMAENISEIVIEWI